MDNQHRLIKGYRDLSQEAIDLINEIKDEGERLQVLVAKICQHIEDQRLAADVEEHLRLDRARAEHWADWGMGSLQLALMQLTRAVAQPSTF